METNGRNTYLQVIKQLCFFPQAVEGFLQGLILILQISGFTSFQIVATQNNPHSLFSKCCIMAGLASSETEKWILTWDRRNLNELSYLQKQ